MDNIPIPEMLSQALNSLVGDMQIPEAFDQTTNSLVEAADSSSSDASLV